MISIDCSEMTLDDQLALASAVSEELAGKGLALVKDDKIVIDSMSRIEASEVVNIVRRFVSRRDDSQHYGVDSYGESIVVHTPDPLARSRGRKDTGQLLPDDLLKCPFCPFVTPFQELYNVHVASHGFGV